MHKAVARVLCVVSATALGLTACASGSRFAERWTYDVPLRAEHVFDPVIRNWQTAQALEGLREQAALPAQETPLSLAFQEFQISLRWQVAGRVLEWVRTQSGLYFRRDGEEDEWPTLGEVLHRGGDDCDGMELLTFRLLRSLGFARGEIYRAVIAHRKTDAHHMVTLWFANGLESEPVVLDATSEVAAGLVGLSQVSDWRPVVLFDERDRFEAVLTR